MGNTLEGWLSQSETCMCNLLERTVTNASRAAIIPFWVLLVPRFALPSLANHCLCGFADGKRKAV